MIPTEADLQWVVARIVANHDPEAIFVFGSYVKGGLHDGSDLDLVVVGRTEVARGRRGLDTLTILAELPFELDLIFVTPRELAAEIDDPWSLLGTVMPSAQEIYRRTPVRA